MKNFGGSGFPVKLLFAPISHSLVTKTLCSEVLRESSLSLVSHFRYAANASSTLYAPASLPVKSGQAPGLECKDPKIIPSPLTHSPIRNGVMDCTV